MPRGNGGIIGPANIPTQSSAKGVWSLSELTLAVRQSIWPLENLSTDTYFEYTTLLLPGNGTNGAQNNTFLDGSTNNFTITRNGNTTQGTFSPFSQTGWGNYFDGSGDQLYLGSSVVANNLASATGADITIECFAYPISFTGASFNITGTTTIWAKGNVYASCIIKSDGAICFAYYNGSVHVYVAQSAAGAVPLNTWNHIACVFTNNLVTIYVNGTSVSSGTRGAASGATNLEFMVGFVTGYTPTSFNGYLSNFRVVNSAVYTGNFTPPTSPLTAISGTSLLTCQSNRFVDNSASPLTITVNGNASVVAFSPFNPTSAWSASTVGGSGYFDGSGDNLSVASNAAFATPSDFTWEAWVYRTTTSDDVLYTGNVTDAFVVQIISNAVVIRQFGVANLITSSATVPTYAWTHIAVARSGTTLSLWINGSRTSGGTTTNSTSFAQNGLLIGVNDIGTNYLDGYLSGLRLVKGTAVYDPTQTSITVPTAPLTAITNTSLLLNFTNAGIYDATSKNNLETVGNAQISNTTAKWGGTSIKFDGTGDWLLIPDQPPQRIGTGNFTVEMWVYRNSSGTYGLAGKGTGTTGWLVSLNSSNQVVFTYGSSTITSSGTVSATTWTHIAVVREGTSTNQTKIYINGTNDGTGTVSTDFNQTNSMYIGADRTGGSAANAYVQDVRITNYARYTANFTAPTAAFPTL